MNKTESKPVYPENAYCAIFCREGFSDTPPDAEETLEHAMGTLTPREADMFMLRYRDEMTYAEIGDKYVLTKVRAQQIIARALRKLRYPSRSKMLVMGLETYLSSVVAANEEKKKQYKARITELEALIQKQDLEIEAYQDKLFTLNERAGYDVLHMSINDLNLSVRSWNCLNRAGLKTVKDILDFGDLSRVRNMGRLSVQEVQDKITAFMKSMAGNPLPNSIDCDNNTQ